MVSDTQNNNLSLSVSKTNSLSGRQCEIAWRDYIATRFVAACCSPLTQSWTIPISHLNTKTQEIRVQVEKHRRFSLIEFSQPENITLSPYKGLMDNIIASTCPITHAKDTKKHQHDLFDVFKSCFWLPAEICPILTLLWLHFGFLSTPEGNFCLC